uniref:protein unc-79 homolog n=1 Tax=Myxine glutinosa TaxID=7769 RepID=UPI00358EFFB5
MSTKAEQFASKIRYLHEYHSRVMHNIYPVPTGTDIANTLKYFSQILLSILLHAGRRDPPDSSSVTVPVPLCMPPIPFPTTPSSLPLVRPGRSPVTRSLLCSVLRDVAFDCAQPSCDSRLAEYPSFDYVGLYAALVYLIDLVPVLQHGPYDLGQAIFYTMACLAPFLHDDILGTLPYTMVSTLATFPSFLHKDILDFLASTFLPMAIFGSSRRESVTAYVNLSAASMLMIVMQYTSNPVYHCQLLECLMKYKQEVWKDLLYVIAYGPAQVKSPAVQMLFHYWPNLKPPGAISEYRGLQYTAWNPIHCQHTECQNPINKPAVKMCMDPTFAVTGGDKPPPLYLCVDCIQKIPRDHASCLFDVLFPQAEISAICQKKNCSSDVKRAVVTCFTEACCRNFGNRPVRYCRRCHHSHHNGIPPAEAHLYQTSIPPINTRECGAEELVCTMEVVVSLLKEVEYHAEQREYALNHRRNAARAASKLTPEHTEPESSDDVMQDQRLLSQFAIWLLLSLCTPNENTPTETLARLVSMVFQWFHSTAYMLDDDVGSMVEKLKPQFVTKWLKSVCDARFDVMVMCLLPKPMEFARVGGYWERSCSAVSQLKEGLNRILSLIPYNVISLAVWECVIPEWLEALRTDVPENHIKEFREVLSKMFDIELCPLPFSMEEMFGFISCRFTGCAAVTQEQALLWLHVLSELDIVVPLVLLINMFLDGVNSVQELAGKRKRKNDPHGSHSPRKLHVGTNPGLLGNTHKFPTPHHMPVMETTQRATLSPHGPFHSPLRQSPQGSMNTDPGGEDEELNLSCYILMLDLILKQMQLQEEGIALGLEHPQARSILLLLNNIVQAPWDGIHACQQEERATGDCGLCQSSALFYELAHDLLAQLVPNEEAILVDGPESLEDSMLVRRPQFIIGEEDENDSRIIAAMAGDPQGSQESTAQTSGKEPEIQEKDESIESKFCLEQLPGALKLIYTILQEMKKFEDPDIVFNMVNCLRALCLRGGVLSSSKYQQTAFLPYILENMLIPSLWEALRSDYSQLPSVATALLQHALTLPQGADIFWAIIDNTFNSKDWKVRFEAVEKVVVLCRFLDVTATAKSHTLKYSLSHALCCYLAAIEDPSPAVNTRARLLLDTIKHSSLRVLCTCLDFQFDMVVKDRPTILTKLLILHNLRPDVQALSWEFFVNRFDTLSLEAQLHLDCNKEFPFPTTITTVRTNVIHLSDAALWKIKRARFARNRQKSVRSLRDSVKRHSNSKRTSSLPDSTSSKLRLQTSGEADAAGKESAPEDGRIDQQTVYLLISTLMRFMIKENAGGDGELSSVKAFSTVKRHLHVLLGFDQQEGCFMVAPNKLRTSTCFHAFISGISQVLDYNIFLGKQFLNMILQVLKYSACPQLRHYFQQPPRCSLWSLRPHIRQLWLKVLLVILYKYPYMEGDTCKLVMHLIHITINTLDAQYHSCKSHPTAGPVCSDNSFTSKYSEKEKNDEDSVFDESEVQDSPACSRDTQTFLSRLKRMGMGKNTKYQQMCAFPQRTSDMELSQYKDKVSTSDILRAPCSPSPQTQEELLSVSISVPSIVSTSHRTARPKNRLSEHQGAFWETTAATVPECHRRSFSASPMVDRCPPKQQSSPESQAPSTLDKDVVGNRLRDGGQVETSVCIKRGFLDIPELKLEVIEVSERTTDDEKENSVSIPMDKPTNNNIARENFLFVTMTQFVDSSEEGSKSSHDKDVENMDSNSCTAVPQVNVEDCSGEIFAGPSKSRLPQSHSEHYSFKQEQTSAMTMDTLGQPHAEPSLKHPLNEENFPKLVYSQGSSSDDSTSQREKEVTKTGQEAKCDEIKEGIKLNEEAGQLKSSFPLLDLPCESASVPNFEIPTVNDESQEATVERPRLGSTYMKRGSLGALVLQPLKQQIEHQGIGLATVSPWDSGTKCNLASLPSIPSMFVPVPEEFAEQSSLAADRCHDCGAVLEEYDEETLSLAIVVLSTFVHLSSDIAAPILLDLLQSVGRIAADVLYPSQNERLACSGLYPWQAESIVIPGNAPGVAKQFLRCIFHQLAPNGILPQLFQSYIKDVNFLRTLANVLSDFSELSSIAALNILLEGLNGKRNLPTGAVMLRCLDNLATFMEALPMESPSNLWASICSQLQAFLPKLPLSLSVKCCLDSCLRIIISILKIPATIATRSLLDHFSKLLSFVIQNSNFSLAYVMDICALCHKNFNKERDKLYLTRSVVLELLQALKFKSTLPDTNLQQLVQFLCVDAGTRIANSYNLQKNTNAPLPMCQTAAMEVMRQYLTDLLDFIADLHTLTKLKAHMKTCTQSLHEDTLGGHLKVGLSQVVGMELTRGNNRDSKAVARHLPWLFHPPSVMQQGPKEFVECVLHIRLLSWLLLGALMHSTLSPSQTSGLLCTPLPLDAGPYMADHLLVVIMGFSEHSRASMAHIASLFHAFIFAQLWTIYCEQQAGPAAPWTPGDVGSAAALSAMEFWSRVTPGILQLIAHNQVVRLGEMVSLHVMNLMEALQSCNSNILVKLLPMWMPMIHSNCKHLSGGLQARLQAIQNRVRAAETVDDGCGGNPPALQQWLHCIQFKMAQVEMQASEASSQFYTL